MMRLALIACVWLAATTAGADEISLSSESRKSLAVAIYNDGHGLIWDRRAALLASGINRVAFGEVSRQMLPSSVMIMSEAGVRLVDFTFDSTLLTQQALLRHFVGKTVGLVRMHPTTGEETVETANLLGVAEKPIVSHRGRIEAVDPGRLVFYEAPQHLRPQPTLLATMECSESGRRDISLGYSTRGLSWSADYIALWNEQAKQLELTGRAALSNTSGAGFPEAELSLIAGSVNREEETHMPPVAFARTAPVMAEAKSIPDPRAVGRSTPLQSAGPGESRRSTNKADRAVSPDPVAGRARIRERRGHCHGPANRRAEGDPSARQAELS